jgi:NADPH:quinone reductase-like Zn-dependent oxidoreductase
LCNVVTWLALADVHVRDPLSPLVSQRLGAFITSENAEDLLTLRDLIESGKVAPAVDRTYPLAEAAAAVRYLLDGHARGKVVISI